MGEAGRAGEGVTGDGGEPLGDRGEGWPRDAALSLAMAKSDGQENGDRPGSPEGSSFSITSAVSPVALSTAAQTS